MLVEMDPTVGSLRTKSASSPMHSLLKVTEDTRQDRRPGTMDRSRVVTQLNSNSANMATNVTKE